MHKRKNAGKRTQQTVQNFSEASHLGGKHKGRKSMEQSVTKMWLKSVPSKSVGLG